MAKQGRQPREAGGWLVPRAPLAALCAALLMAGAAVAQPASPARELSVADYRSYLPETHSVRKALRYFAEAVQVKSNGRLRIEVWPGTVAGTPAAQIQALRQALPGAPRIMLVAATGLADLQPPFALFDLPYAVPDERHADAIMDGDQGAEMLAGLSAVGLAGLGWMENGFRQISSTRAVIQAPGDLAGVAVRTLPVATSTAAFAAWGARPVALPAARVRDALRSRAIEAQEGFITQLLQSRLYEVQAHLWLTNHSYGAQVLVMNAEAWNDLLDIERQWLREAAQEASRQQRAWSRAEARQAMAELESLGMAIHPVPAQTLKAMADATEDVRHPGPGV